MEAAVRPGTLVDAVVPCGTRSAAFARDALLVVSGAALVAGAAQVTIPWDPVPLTGQTFAVLLVGGLLGVWRAVAALTLYWVVGALGAPIFSDAAGGWDAATAPSGGYIIGFIVAAAVVGWFCERGADRSVLAMFGVLFLGNVIIYAFGLPWLAESNIGVDGADFGWANAWTYGAKPFIAGDIVKLLAVAGLLPAGWAIARKIGIRGAREGRPPTIA
jgi:biotin transport system substrate-specific component